MQGRGRSSMKTALPPDLLGTLFCKAEAGQGFPCPFQPCNSHWIFLITGPLDFLLFKTAKLLSREGTAGVFPMLCPSLGGWEGTLHLCC